jgi:hypothetical protein
MSIPPIPDADSRPFWAAASERRLRIQCCTACGRYIYYPRVLCPHCHAADPVWTDVSGRGRIYSFTVARRPAAPEFQDRVPYVVALVDLEEGARMLTNIVGCAPEDVRIGRKVEVDYLELASDVTVPVFRLAG